MKSRFSLHLTALALSLSLHHRSVQMYFIRTRVRRNSIYLCALFLKIVLLYNLQLVEFIIFFVCSDRPEYAIRYDRPEIWQVSYRGS